MPNFIQETLAAAEAKRAAAEAQAEKDRAGAERQRALTDLKLQQTQVLSGQETKNFVDKNAFVAGVKKTIFDSGLRDALESYAEQRGGNIYGVGSPDYLPKGPESPAGSIKTEAFWHEGSKLAHVSVTYGTDGSLTLRGKNTQVLSPEEAANNDRVAEALKKTVKSPLDWNKLPSGPPSVPITY